MPMFHVHALNRLESHMSAPSSPFSVRLPDVVSHLVAPRIRLFLHLRRILWTTWTPAKS
jgi:hypothetical protein